MTKQYQFNPDNIWFTSDTHFDHSNIIKFCTRPFKDVDEMNEALIRKWNETVPTRGIVFHLGDFVFGGLNVLENIANRLNGTKYLILGNHDIRQQWNNSARLSQLFEHVTQQMTILVEGQTIILNHYPLLTYAGAWGDRLWNLHGHVHLGPHSNGLDDERMKLRFPTQYDVGVDNNDFRPVSFREVKDIITKQCDINNYHIDAK